MIVIAAILGAAMVLSLGATTIISNTPKAFATTEAFVATLSGDKEVPPVQTQATGTAGFSQPHLSNMSYGVQVTLKGLQQHIYIKVKKDRMDL